MLSLSGRLVSLNLTSHCMEKYFSISSWRRGKWFIPFYISIQIQTVRLSNHFHGRHYENFNDHRTHTSGGTGVGWRLNSKWCQN